MKSRRRVLTIPNRGMKFESRIPEIGLALSAVILRSKPTAEQELSIPSPNRR